MGLIIMLLATWLVMTLYITLARKIGKKENVFLFCIVLVINIQLTWIFGEEFKLLVISKRVPEYLAFILYRSALLPFMVLSFLNLLLASRSYYAKALVFFAYELSLLLIETFIAEFNIYSFSKWTLCYLLLYYFLLLIAAELLLTWYRKHFSSKMGTPLG